MQALTAANLVSGLAAERQPIGRQVDGREVHPSGRVEHPAALASAACKVVLLSEMYDDDATFSREVDLVVDEYVAECGLAQVAR